MKTIEQRFWPMVDKDGPIPKHRPELGKCWVWRGATNRGGYGFLCHDKKNMRAHKVSYKIHKGEIEKGMCVCHECDFRKCVRPEHLFKDTQKGNLRDAMKKGRMNFKGLIHEKNRSLTDKEALEIINTPNYRGVGVFLAKKYNLTTATISRIRLGKSYASLHSNPANQ